MKTIARNATRKIAAIKENTTSIRVHSLTYDFIPVEADNPEYVWNQLATHPGVRLIDNEDGTYTIHVHDNLWYKLTTTTAQVAPTQAPAAAGPPARAEQITCIEKQLTLVPSATADAARKHFEATRRTMTEAQADEMVNALYRHMRRPQQRPVGSVLLSDLLGRRV